MESNNCNGSCQMQCSGCSGCNGGCQGCSGTCTIGCKGNCTNSCNSSYVSTESPLVYRIYC